MDSPRPSSRLSGSSYQPARRPSLASKSQILPRRVSPRAQSAHYSEDEAKDAKDASSRFRDWWNQKQELAFEVSLRIPKHARRTSSTGRPVLSTIQPSYEKQPADFLTPTRSAPARPRSALDKRIVRTEENGSTEENGHSIERPKSRVSFRLPPTSLEDEKEDQPRSSLSTPKSDGNYPYLPLRPHEFRLLQILPAKTPGIKCKIYHAFLEDPPSYVAISYAWGDIGDKKDVVIDGHNVAITTSLHGVLDAIRENNEPVLVWADAACINQQDDDERSQHAKMISSIYAAATGVALWLGAEDDNSSLAMDLLEGIAEQADSPDNISRIIFSYARKRGFDAIVALFERDYWNRLWVVQEVLNAKSVTVYCGDSKLPWPILQKASATFRRHNDDLLDRFGPGAESLEQYASSKMNPYPRVLAYRGPARLNIDVSSLHEAILACRRRQASNPRDKVYGLLGLLSKDYHHEIPVDYRLPVKDVYTDVVDYVIATTKKLDIVCDAIHYPPSATTINLPTWVPDYSQHLGPPPLRRVVGTMFSASRSTKARAEILADRGRRNRLQISAVYLDTIATHGMAVGESGRLEDYLMFFLQGRSHLLNTFGVRDRIELELAQEDFAAALCLGLMPDEWQRPSEWLTVCYHAFASQIHDRFPYLPLDAELASFADTDIGISASESRDIIYSIGKNISGRCFCITKNGLLGLGSGFMAEGDIVVVPLGCATPVLLRPEGTRGEYRFVGDVFIKGFMYGRAIEELDGGRRELGKFVIH